MDHDPVFDMSNTIHVSHPRPHPTEEEALAEVLRRLDARADPPGALVLAHTSWGSRRAGSYRFAALRFRRGDDATWTCVRRGV